MDASISIENHDSDFNEIAADMYNSRVFHHLVIAFFKISFLLP